MRFIVIMSDNKKIEMAIIVIITPIATGPIAGISGWILTGSPYEIPIANILV
jgi:hypothetical protein